MYATSERQQADMQALREMRAEYGTNRVAPPATAAARAHVGRARADYDAYGHDEYGIPNNVSPAVSSTAADTSARKHTCTLYTIRFTYSLTSVSFVLCRCCKE
jgi:hypothetical protein